MKTLRGRVYDALRARDYTLKELYGEFPTYNPRSIREVVLQLKNDEMLSITSCRCHGTSIYEAKNKGDTPEWV